MGYDLVGFLVIDRNRRQQSCGIALCQMYWTNQCCWSCKLHNGNVAKLHICTAVSLILSLFTAYFSVFDITQSCSSAIISLESQGLLNLNHALMVYDTI